MALFAKNSILLTLGLSTLLLTACTQPNPRQSASLAGYAPMERHALSGFSLGVARTRSETAEPFSFGMLSGMFSEATPYQLNYAQKSEHVQLASAAPMPLPAMRSDGAIIMPDATETKSAPRLRPTHSDYFGL